jgi:hypothetical protein
MSTALVPRPESSSGQVLPSSFPSKLPSILLRAGKTAGFRERGSFCGRIRNEHTIADDIVYHFPRRGYLGKGMVVSLDKFTAVKMFDKVQRRWKWRRPIDA